MKEFTIAGLLLIAIAAPFAKQIGGVLFLAYLLLCSTGMCRGLS
jgi:hypothetical protein